LCYLIQKKRSKTFSSKKNVIKIRFGLNAVFFLKIIASKIKMVSRVVVIITLYGECV
jgi:hypothetical protein